MCLGQIWSSNLEREVHSREIASDLMFHHMRQPNLRCTNYFQQCVWPKRSITLIFLVQSFLLFRIMNVLSVCAVSVARARREEMFSRRTPRIGLSSAWLASFCQSSTSVGKSRGSCGNFLYNGFTKWSIPALDLLETVNSPLRSSTSANF